MTGRGGVVYDRGYVPHEGPRLGRRAAVVATVKDGVRRVFGLRRRARKKVLPWALVALAMLPAIVFVGLAFFLSNFNPDLESPFGGHPEYFLVAGPIIVLFSALAAPELLIPDREEGVLAVYASRPITVSDYLLARAGAYAVTVLGFLLIPQVLMYIGFAALDSDGFLEALLSNWLDLVKVTAASVAFVAGFGAPAFLVSVYSKRVTRATVIFLGVMIGATGIAAAISQSGAFSGARWAALLALSDHPTVLLGWIFDSDVDSVPGEAGLGELASLVMIVLLLTLTAALAVRRYRRLM